MIEALCPAETLLINGRSQWAENVVSTPSQPTFHQILAAVCTAGCDLLPALIQLPLLLLSSRTGYEKARQPWEMAVPIRTGYEKARQRWEMAVPSVNHSSHWVLLTMAPLQNQRPTSGTSEFQNHLNLVVLHKLIQIPSPTSSFESLTQPAFKENRNPAFHLTDLGD